MKQFSAIIFVVVSILLAVVLVVTKHSDNAQMETDAGTIVDFSNRLDTAQLDLSVCRGTAIILSNSLDECRSAALTFSNHLLEAESALALDAEQITNLNRQVAEMKSENQTLSGRIEDLTSQMTNQVAGLTRQITLTQASLEEARTNYALLQNRFLRDVAERVVVERKFNNPDALRAQLRMLKTNLPAVISAESIYAGLNVEVKSNGAAHVISPD